MHSATSSRRRLMTAASAAVLSLVALGSTPAHAVVVPDTTTTAAVIDTTNTRPYWVGLGIRNEAGNSGGTCTGLLINPRTVLFAAHCVDSLAPAAYDGDSVGNRARVMYSTDPTFGTPNIQQWLFGQDFGPQSGADGRTPTGQSVFVWYDPRSRFGSAPVANNGTFLPADVAIAGFDGANELLGRDAAGGIGLLFSPVNGAVPVTIGGYGQSGVEPGTTRVSDFQRRLGTNVMSFLGSGRDINVGVYGTAIADVLGASTLVHQDLYWTDFDDPRRGTRPFFAGPGSLPISDFSYDFDVFPGAATANEVTTAPGDSGSPLVTNAFTLNGAAREVSLGVLSQGSRFFFDSLGNPDDNFVRTCQNTNVGSNFSCLGTLSGYNPLFLFWNQIVVNNPYKYVRAAAGDGEWTDAARWTQEIDPLYFTLTGTTLTNALPATPALGVSGAAANVGTITANPAPPALCAFFGTCSEPMPGVALPGQVALPGDVTLAASLSIEGEPAPAAGIGITEFDMRGLPASSASGEFLAAGLPAQSTNTLETTIPGTPDSSPMTTATWASGTLIPVSTGTLTGPGTTNFVPNNTLGTPGVQNSTRWFEVNLRNTGTTFLTGTAVTIDRLSVRNAGAGLNIRAGASLTTVISSFLDTGTVTVAGTFAPAQFNVLGGLLQGTGTITTPRGLNVTGGTLTPGGLGTTGTLAVTGNVQFAAAGLFGVDVAATGGDRLNVTGALALGGGIAVNAASAIDFGQSWTVASATGGVTGAFGTVATNFAGLLRPRVTVNPTTVVVDVTALPMGTYLGGLSGQNVTQFATALDAARAGNYTALRDLYRSLDVLSPADLQRAVEQLSPSGLPAADQVQDLLADLMASNVTGRLAQARGASTAGLGAGSGLTALGGGATVEPAALPVPGLFELAPGWGAFVDIRYAEGDASPALIANGADIEAFAVTAGIDNRISDNWIAGLALNYAGGESEAALSKGETVTWAATAYAGYTAGRFFLDAYASLGVGTVDTTRAAGGAVISGSTSGSFFALGAAAGLDVALGETFGLIPALSIEHQSLGLDGYAESGGAAALAIGSRDIESTVVRFGGTLHGDFTTSTGGIIRPRVTVNYAWDAANDGAGIGSASFVSAPGVVVSGITANAGDDQWFEGAVGVDMKPADQNVSLSLSYERDFDRDNFETETVRATLRLQF